MRIHIPGDVFFEIVGDDPAQSSRRARKLGNLLVKFSWPGRIFISMPVHYWLKREIRKRGKLSSPPSMTARPEFVGLLNTFTNEERYAEFLKNSVEERRRSAEITNELHMATKNLRAASGKVINQKELRELISNYGRFVNPKDIGFFTDTLPLPKPISGNRIRKIMRARNRYTFTKTFVWLSHLRGLANGLLDTIQNDPLQFAAKLKKNDFSDTHIVATGAFFEFFVTEDNGQLGFTVHAFKLKLVYCKPITLDEFLRFIRE